MNWATSYWWRGADLSECGAAAEDRQARCRAHSEVAGGRTVSAHLDDGGRVVIDGEIKSLILNFSGNQPVLTQDQDPYA